MSVTICSNISLMVVNLRVSDVSSALPSAIGVVRKEKMADPFAYSLGKL